MGFIVTKDQLAGLGTCLRKMIFIPAVILLQIAEVRKMMSLSSKTKDFIGA